jgi:hypothetical protein
MADQESTLQPGDVIAEYSIEKVLGSGSFGVTYLARDMHLSRGVAIKEYMPVVYARRDSGGTVVSRNLETAATFEWGLERFSEEARTLAQFNHPNIVRVLRLVQGVNGTAYIAMELLEGKNLETLVEEDGPLPPETFLSVFRQLLDGCESIHRIGILHRDIKPANVVIRGETPVLIDFGAARDLAVQQKAGFSALVTDGFSPLEQYSREIRQTEATDIYALGATAYFLITGRIPPPSAARSCGEVLTPAVEAARGLLPPDVLKAIDWSLALRMADRPDSIAKWRAAMPSLDAVAPVAGQADGPGRAPLALNRRGVLIAGGGLLVAGGAAFALLTRDTSLSSSARPLRIAWSKRLAQVSGEPFAGVALAGADALVGAHRIGDDGDDRLLALRIGANGDIRQTFELPERGSRAHAILPAADGGAYVAGESGSISVLARLGRDWKPVWVQKYGEGSISSLMARAGGVVAGMEGSASSNAAKLLFLSDKGVLEQSVAMADLAGDSVQGVAQLPGGDFAVLGMRVSEEGTYAWVARRPSQGEEAWRIRLTGLLRFTNGWGIAAANGKIYVTGRTKPAEDESGYRLFVMRLDPESGRTEWSFQDKGQAPSSGRGFAVVGMGGAPRLYLAGWAGKPRASQWAQVGPDGDLLWTQVDRPAAGVETGAAGLALAEDGSGFGIGLEAPNKETLHLTLTRFT